MTEQPSTMKEMGFKSVKNDIEQPKCHQTMTSRECIGCSIDAAGECPLTDKDKNTLDKPEQPNTELLIVKTIQGLTTCINNELEKLVVLRGCMPINNMMVVIDQAIEDINLFEKNPLFKLQKAFE